MDAALRKDIVSEYTSEYIAAEKKQLTGFWKKLTDFNAKIYDTIDHVVNDNKFMKKLKVKYDPAGVILIGAVLPFLLSPVAGFIGVGALFVDLLLQANANGIARERAEKKLGKDIDDGTLSERYSAVLDGRIKSHTEQVELYATQKSQLPAKGAAVEAFTAAVADVAKEPVVPAPAVVPPAPSPQ